LLDKYILLDSEFITLRKCSKDLDPFAVKTRYPDDARFELSLADVQELVACSKRILNFVSSKINKTEYL
jgi:HEPN domain-containing protein